MDLWARVNDLISAPKARWALAWLAAAPSDEPSPLDFQDAKTAKLRTTRLYQLRDNPAGLLAEVHTRVEDWRYESGAQTAVVKLGPPAGYQRLAAALAKSAAAAWWWEPVRRNAQTWICAEPILEAAGLPFVTSYGHHWDRTALAKAVMTSTRLDRLPAVELLSDQTRLPHLRTSPDMLTAWAVRIKPEARVAEIHSPADWVDLVQRYPSHRTDLCLAPRLEALWPAGARVFTVDWHSLAADYEGVHLSVAGWLTATSQVLSLTKPEGYTFCEGWPTEGMLWFKPTAFTGKFDPIDADHRLEYGYGRPRTGSRHDLRTPPSAVAPWWRRRWFTTGGRAAG